MKRLLLLITASACIGLSAMSGTALATTAQQDRMTTCNATAKTKALAGDARKTFMKSCLSGDEATATTNSNNSQQNKMKTCNADAASKNLSGDARKQFMSSCLKGK